MSRPVAPVHRRILFVDDELNIVDGLRRSLRSHREHWDMVFCTSGPEALALVKTEGFDIVIADLRMPWMSGTELLTEIQRIAPGTIRMILSGQSEISAIVKAVGPSHQFLAKPCDLVVLERCIQRAFALREVTSDPRVLDLIGGIRTLPSIPSLYQRVVAAIKDERPLAEIGAIVSQDMGMTARVLQLVNSSYFGLARRIEDPAQAILMLGIDTLQSLVLGAKVFEEFSTDAATLNTLWSRSSQAALIARKLCAFEKVDAVTATQTMVASFLHSVGLVALAARAPELFNKVFSGLDAEPCQAEVQERELIGASHTQIGAALLSLWGLPDAIAEAVAFQRCPGPMKANGFAPITFVHVAQAFARGVPVDDSRETLQCCGVDVDYLDSLGILGHMASWRTLCNPA